MDHMEHMNHMNHATGSGADFLFLLGLVFMVGALFYLFRLASPRYMRQVNGYWDPQNEFWHGACLLAMTTMLAPFAVPLLTATVWMYVLPVGVVWYVIRAFTYGKKVPFNKQWYDFAHAAMLFGMWWMFAQVISHPIITIVFAGYWTWFASYYATRIWADFKKPHWLSFGQDLLHFTMAVVMVLMTLFPNTFMPMHSHEAMTIPQSAICSPGHTR